MAILTCRDMSFAYDGKTVLEGVNFSLSAGDYLCVVGENGSGKSTSINMINGSFPVTSGKIYFNDKDITGWKMHKIAAAGMGRTYQNLKLFRSMTALENVMIGGQLHAKMNFARFLVDPFKTKREEEELREACKQLNVEVDETFGKGKLIDAIFGQYCEEELIQPDSAHLDYEVSDTAAVN